MALFSWFKKDNGLQNITKIFARRPKYIDFTESLVVNSDLTKDLYHNQYPGMKLAGGLAYPIIAVPVFFMGFPIPKVTDDQQTQEILNYLSEIFTIQFEQNHTTCHREGTSWLWHKYDSKSQKLIIEFIDDDSVTDIIRSLETGEIIELYTDDEIRIATGYDKTINVRRLRHFTKQKITINYTGGIIPTNLQNKTYRNILGSLPIYFSNNNDANEVRGYSDYERVIYDLKRYHDIDLAEADILSKFKTKMVQNVDNVATWLANNGLTSETMTDFDIANIDLIFNVGEEKTDFVFPKNATDAYNTSLKRTFRKIVEESGVPELVWGVKTEGNANTAEEQMATLIKYVQDKQRRKNDAYKQLFSNLAKLYSIANNTSINLDTLKISWNDLDAASDKVKSEIFKNFSQGLASITNAAALTEDQVYKLWLLNFPKATDQDFEAWKAGYSQAAVRRTLLNTDVATATDAAGLVDEMGI